MSIETTEEHLKVFSDACLKYQKEYGLTNWELHFKRDDIEFVSQTLHVLSGYVATMVLCETWNDDQVELSDAELVSCARHEMLHLLLGRLTSYALWRFVEKDAVMEADEEIVRRLEYILDHLGGETI